MTAKKAQLKKAQREALISWVAEGLSTDEINERAAKFKPKFEVSWRVVTYYRKSRGVNVQEVREQGELDALKTGLAVKENRVIALNRLAQKMIDDLADGHGLWLTNYKGIGRGQNYEKIEYQEFNRAEVESLRGVLEDIAAEIGDRIRKADLTSGGKPLPRPGIDPSLLKNLSEHDLSILEAAAEIAERSGADQDSSLEN